MTGTWEIVYSPGHVSLLTVLFPLDTNISVNPPKHEIGDV